MGILLVLDFNRYAGNSSPKLCRGSLSRAEFKSELISIYYLMFSALYAPFPFQPILINVKINVCNKIHSTSVDLSFVFVFVLSYERKEGRSFLYPKSEK